MKVKVGDRVYDSEDEPVMVILSKKDKSNIEKMPENYTKYCGYPDEGFTDEEITKWIRDV